jgi:hypothetical protein
MGAVRDDNQRHVHVVAPDCTQEAEGIEARQTGVCHDGRIAVVRDELPSRITIVGQVHLEPCRGQSSRMRGYVQIFAIRNQDAHNSPRVVPDSSKMGSNSPLAHLARLPHEESDP